MMLKSSHLLLLTVLANAVLPSSAQLEWLFFDILGFPKCSEDDRCGNFLIIFPKYEMIDCGADKACPLDVDDALTCAPFWTINARERDGLFCAASKECVDAGGRKLHEVFVQEQDLTRRLQASTAGERATSFHQVNTAMLQDTAESCDTDLYELSLFVSDHLTLAASPISPSSDACDHIVVFHDQIQAKNSKTVHFASHVAEEHKDQLFAMGTFSFQDIRTAFDQATGRPKGVAYDVVTNNCATLIIQILKGLGLDPTGDLVDYIVDKLTVHGGSLLPNVKPEHFIMPGLEKEAFVEQDFWRQVVSKYVAAEWTADGAFEGTL